jgi:phenylalanine-4-hydroxylase
VQYLRHRNQFRVRRVDAMWEALTEREQALVRESAVMGFVQGVRLAPKTRSEWPRDHETVALVLDAVTSFGDQYPTLNALARSTKPTP